MHDGVKSEAAPDGVKSEAAPQKLDDNAFDKEVTSLHAVMKELWPKKAGYPPIEPLSSCLLANRYYVHHAPEPSNTNLLILAESHASADPSIVGCSLKETGLEEVNPVHFGHLNLVHCLSYGEEWLLSNEKLDSLDKKLRRSIGAGTYKFWRLFSALSGDLDHDGNLENDPLADKNDTHLSKLFLKIEKKNKNCIERVNEKTRILEKMKERGILMVDVSPVPIYIGGGGNTSTLVNKKTGNLYTSKTQSMTDPEKRRLLRAAWKHYASALIERIRPKYVLVLGCSVMGAISKESMADVVSNGKSTFLGHVFHPSSNECCADERFKLILRYARRLASYVSSNNTTDDPHSLIAALQETNEGISQRMKIAKQAKRDRRALEGNEPKEQERKRARVLIASVDGSEMVVKVVSKLQVLVAAIDGSRETVVKSGDSQRMLIASVDGSEMVAKVAFETGDSQIIKKESTATDERG